MKVSSKVHYGLRAMTELARAYGQGPVALSEVARVEHLSLGYLEQLISALRFKVPFPAETIKARVLAAVKELLALRETAMDPANTHVPGELRDELARRTGESLAALWPLCQKLALVARAKVKPELLKERLDGVAKQLEDLAANAETTRHQLAHLTLGATPMEIHEATEQMGAMKWQVTEMQRLDAMLEG